MSAALQQQMASGEAHLFYNFIPRAENIAATDEGIAGFAQRMSRAPQTSVVSNVGSLPALPALPGLTVHTRSFALCPSRTQSLFSAVSSDERGLTINLNHNAAQFSQTAAAQVAARMQQLLLQAAR